MNDGKDHSVVQIEVIVTEWSNKLRQGYIQRVKDKFKSPAAYQTCVSLAEWQAYARWSKVISDRNSAVELGKTMVEISELVGNIETDEIKRSFSELFALTTARIITAMCFFASAIIDQTEDQRNALGSDVAEEGHLWAQGFVDDAYPALRALIPTLPESHREVKMHREHRPSPFDSIAAAGISLN